MPELPQLGVPVRTLEVPPLRPVGPDLLPPLRSCVLCPLHAECRSPGIGTYHLRGSPDPVAGERALLIVGQNPGYHEDQAGLPFVGRSGSFLRLILLRQLPAARHHLGDPHAPTTPPPRSTPPSNAWDLAFEPPPPSFLPTYVTNAARCFTAADSLPPSSYRSCLPHLATDLTALVAFHSSLIVLCLGAPAAASTLHLLTSKKITLTRALSYNGTTFPFSSGSVTFFSTFHPAHVLRNRGMLLPVLDHLALLRSHLSSTLPSITKPHIVPPFLPRSPAWEPPSRSRPLPTP